MIIAKGAWTPEVVAVFLLGIAVLYVIVSFWGADKDAGRLAQVWRAYASQHGHRVDVPGRFSFLSLSEGQVHAKLEGVRNGLPFTVEITAWDPEEGGTKDTSFQCSPTWLPDSGMITITRGAPPKSWLVPQAKPAFVRHRLNVFLHPPELAVVFDHPEADRVLADFARLPASTDATGWRKDLNAKYHGVKSILFVTANDWCDDPQELDATIDVLTRLCGLRSPIGVA